jgi:hypothetical protein
MKTQNKKSTEDHSTFRMLDEIQEVEVSPFFKNKVLAKIREQNEETVPLRGWFTLQLQLVAAIVILMINTATIFYSLDEFDSDSEVSGI